MAFGQKDPLLVQKLWKQRIEVLCTDIGLQWLVGRGRRGGGGVCQALFKTTLLPTRRTGIRDEI